MAADTGEGLKRFAFPKKKRLLSNRQFKAVLDCRRRVCNELLTVYLAGNDCGYPRLGVSVARSCGGAVARNRLKRLIREAFRLSQEVIPEGFDYLVMISPVWIQRQTKGGRLKEAVMGLSLNEVKTAFEGLAKSALPKGGQKQNEGER